MIHSRQSSGKEGMLDTSLNRAKTFSPIKWEKMKWVFFTLKEIVTDILKISFSW